MFSYLSDAFLFCLENWQNETAQTPSIAALVTYSIRTFYRDVWILCHDIHIRQMPPYLIRLRRQRAHAHDEQLIAVILPRALDAKDEMVSHPSQLDFILELRVAQAFPGHGIPEGVLDHRLLLSDLVLIILASFRRVLFGEIFETNNPLRETPREFLRIIPQNRLHDINRRHQAIASRSNGRKLSMIAPSPLPRMQLHRDLLPRPQFRDQNIRIHRPDHILPRERIDLLADGVERDIPRINIMPFIQLLDVIRLALLQQLLRSLLPLTRHFQPHEDGILIRRLVALGVAFAGRALEIHLRDGGGVAGEGDQAEAVREHFVLDYRGVVVYEDVFDGDGGDFGEEDAAEGVC